MEAVHAAYGASVAQALLDEAAAERARQRSGAAGGAHPAHAPRAAKRAGGSTG